MKVNVKPVLTYGVYQRREETSWRPWGGVQTEGNAQEEAQRIERELDALALRASFPMEIKPLSSLTSLADLSGIEEELGSADVTLIYAAGGGQDILEALVASSRWSIIFLRHRSGPLYLWYEIIHPSFLRKRLDEFVQPKVGVDDVIVDDYEEVLWRLRALYGLKNALGSRIVAIGSPSGWAIGDKAVTLAQQKWNLDIKTVTYPDLAERIRKARGDEGVLRQAQQQAEEYLSQRGVSLHTKRSFVDNAFVLYRVFRELMGEHDAQAITVNECMTTIIPIAQTTACLPLSLINDTGDLAFCESDFVVIPSGILLHHISGKPVFLNDPTYPHDGVVTLAHCTAPRRMSGENDEPADIVTHFESDYGAAPKVEFRRGQQVTLIVPDFQEKSWVVSRGKILDTPSLPICRSQADVEIEGDWRKLLREMKGFHWMMCYGDYVREIEYALSKVGLEVVAISP
jgi:L-fucose isomerase-like protein